MTKRLRIRVKRLASVLGAAVVTVLLLGAVAIALTNRSFSASGRVARNVTIAGIEVEGLNADRALEALHTRWVPTLPKEVSLKHPGGEVKRSPENLGVKLMLEDAVGRALLVGRQGNLLTQLAERIKLWRSTVNVEVATTVAGEQLRRALVEVAEQIDRKPRNARIKVVGEKVEVVPGREAGTDSH